MRALKGRGGGIEGAMTRWFAAVTAREDRHRSQAEMVRKRVPRGGRVLEVAPGPGYTAVELAANGEYQVAGIDINPVFVEIARSTAADAGVAVDFREGDVGALPFGDETFDFVLCCNAFKDFPRPVTALREMARVLAPGGKALVIDSRRDLSKAAVDDYIDQMHLGAFNGMLTRINMAGLSKRAYTEGQFRGFFTASGFSSIEISETATALEIDFIR